MTAHETGNTYPFNPESGTLKSKAPKERHHTGLPAPCAVRAIAWQKSFRASCDSTTPVSIFLMILNTATLNPKPTPQNAKP